MHRMHHVLQSIRNHGKIIRICHSDNLLPIRSDRTLHNVRYVCITIVAYFDINIYCINKHYCASILRIEQVQEATKEANEPFKKKLVSWEEQTSIRSYQQT